MADFEPAVLWTLRKEGLLSNDAQDRGGLTKYGITHLVAKQYGFADVRLLTLEQAKGIYRASYWRHGGIASQRVATKVFDCGVNTGVRTAIILLQKTVNQLRSSGITHIALDGLIGPNTERAVNECRESDLLEVFRGLQLERYAAIIAENARERVKAIRDGKPIPKTHKDQAVFALGWIRRGYDLPY